MVARAAVAAVSLVLLVWLGVMLYDERALRRGVEISGRLQGPADAARAEAAFRDARLLNPDTGADTGRALVYAAGGRRAGAVALLEDVLRREPENLTAWALVYGLTRESEPAAARRALAARRRLDPLSARPR